MALVIYPSTGFDSFISVADATDLLALNVLDLTKWNALTNSHKEIYLRQSTLLIKNKIDLDLVADTTNLELATSLLANYSIGLDMNNSTSDSNLKRKKLDGVMEKEYFAPSKKSNSFPDNVLLLLKDYGLMSSTSHKVAR